MINNEYIKAYKKTQQSSNTVISSHQIVRALMKELVNSMQKIVLDIQDDRTRNKDVFSTDKNLAKKNRQIKAKNSHTWENRFNDMMNIIKETI